MPTTLAFQGGPRLTCYNSYAMMKRGEIRERYGIKGSGMGDCCASYWCGCCALIQQDKEVKARVAAGPITQGYQGQKEGMHMPPAQQQQQMPPQQMSPQPMSPQPTYHQAPEGSFPPQQPVYDPNQPQAKY